MTTSVTFRPLGDRAVLLTCPNEAAVAAWVRAIDNARLGWVIDVVAAYASLAVHYDPALIRFREAVGALQRLRPSDTVATAFRRFRIPVCYEMQLDFERIREATGLSPERIVESHTATEYTVYAIGFTPGFPYLGYLPSELSGVPRLASPRLRLEPGSVGLAGRQTGIYPMAKPGGWNIVGRTPLVIVDPPRDFFPLQVGDRVRFAPIDKSEFHGRFGEPLAPEFM